MLKYKIAKIGGLLLEEIYGGDSGNIVNRVCYAGMLSSDEFSLIIITKKDRLYQGLSPLIETAQSYYPNEKQKVFLNLRNEPIIHVKTVAPDSIEYYVEQKPLKRDYSEEFLFLPLVLKSL
ncbi:MAG: hypothetical protein U9R34_07635 [Nanoarchaeota archaeon]|nr:hypothetical protein [Nanoarchaeota archaeon]